jgi:hypothetical protein
VPTQALGMLNSEFLQEQSRAMAGRLEREAPGDRAAQIARGIRLVSGRTPAADEVAADEAFVGKIIAEHRLEPSAALAVYCLMLLNTNEFAYLD